MENNTCYNIKNLSFAYDNKLILDNLSLSIPKGKIVTIMGPNGCGKSTLFSLLTKNNQPLKGQIYLGSQDLKSLSLHDFSQRVAIVHQNNTAPADMTVEQLVSYGRTPFTKMGRPLDKAKDSRYIERALKITGLESLGQRPIAALSGGQRQRVWIAMALAQGTKTLLLDEPTTYLDVRYQLQILRLVRALNDKLGMTIIMVLHDINQAIAYSDQVICLDRSGKLVTQGCPKQVITSESLEAVYGLHLDTADVGQHKIVLTV